VFNHVGRGFWAFQDVLSNREHSQYKDWFHVDFGRPGALGSAFWYEGWEGHYELVKLNLQNPAVREHIFGCVAGWVEQFGIDGLRLDVAYMLDADFLRGLRAYTKSLHPDFFLLSEIIHGDYNRLLASTDSCTNYECYKGIYSAINERNMFEIAYSLNRQFGPEGWTLYKNRHLLSFVDNHDVTRIASQIKQSANLPVAFGLLFSMPGVPCLYYGSEWGERAEKAPGSDAALRPCFAEPQSNSLTGFIRGLAAARAENPALRRGGYRQLYLTNTQLVFEREIPGEGRVVAAFNIDSAEHETGVLPTSGKLYDLLGKRYVDFGGKITLAPHSAALFRLD
jgi:glycosidase